jgi:hypothetical protein
LQKPQPVFAIDYCHLNVQYDSNKTLGHRRALLNNYLIARYVDSGAKFMPFLIRILSRENRGRARVAVAAAFLFFVLYSAPHRVHHFFEQGPVAAAQDNNQAWHRDPSAANGHDHERESPQPKPTDCAAQLAAQNTHFAAPSPIAFPFREIIRAQSEIGVVTWAATFNPSPFSQRAPPPV